MPSDFLKRLSESTPMILDGAIGTELLKSHPVRIVDQLNIDAPECVADLHRRYIAAGAEIIKTNTFNCCDPTLFDTDLRRQLTVMGVAVARKVADEFSSPHNPVFVAGSIGPTSIQLSEAKRNDIEQFNTLRDDLMEACRMVATIMIEGGSDLLLVETAYDLESLTAALEAIESTRKELSVETPIAVSVTIDPTAITIASGQSLSDVIKHIDRFRVAMIGINCVDYQHIFQATASLRALTGKPLILSPNTGNSDHQVSPIAFAACTADVIWSASPAVVGGCCGTTPEHIRAISKLVVQQ